MTAAISALPPPGPPAPAPRWMRRWLLAAAIYNIAWGGIMVLAPVWSMRQLGVAPATTELWPQLWACIGMIVGVYGVGYAVAARDPLRHWPIILVGLLGKILGPIGFVDAAVRDLLPWSMGVTILTNDLLWWAPFSMILWGALKAAQPAPPAGAVALGDALGALRDQRGRTLAQISDERPTLVVLVRHSGCTFCREALHDLAKGRSPIDEAGLNVAVVGLGADPARLKALADQYALRDAAIFVDPERLLYRALELRRGTFLQLFGPRTIVRGFSALVRGYGIGALEGDGLQMPGVFVIHRGRVAKAFRHARASDRPDVQEIACSIS